MKSLGVYKFSSCDGCQLAILDAHEDLLKVFSRFDVRHFAEAGPIDEEAEVDVALIEGSVSTPEELKRIEAIRQKSKFLIAMGACATSGGIQALRNRADGLGWLSSLYGSPEPELLAISKPPSAHVRVDHLIWGCPVTTPEVLDALSCLALGIVPRPQETPLCLECKKKGHVCVIVSRGAPCVGPTTRAGCQALCPGLERACYGCTGPLPQANIPSLASRFGDDGLNEEEVKRRFVLIHGDTPQVQEVFPQGGA